MKIKKVLTANLKPGMVSSEAAYTYTNHLVIQSNTVLTEEIIEKLKYYAVKAVKVYVQEESENTSGTVNSKQSNVLETVEGVSAQVLPEGETDTVSAAVEQLAGPTYFERVQQSEEFRVFESEFTDCVGGFRQSLNDIVTKSTDGLVDSMLGDVDALLKKTRNPLHLLDMLQCMRGYDDMTYTHSMNVALICNVIGNWLRMNEKDLKVLVTCGLLHDIGKIRIPEEILNKPGRLTDEEFKIMKTHSEIGASMIWDMHFLQDHPLVHTAWEICRWHHERWDGKGYPDGLKGEEIPISAQVVSIVDVYDALTSERCYKKAFEHDTAIKMILDGQCGQFNPVLLKCLKELSLQFSKMYKNETNDNTQYYEAQRLSDEILKEKSLPRKNYSQRVIKLMQEKIEFFKMDSGKISIEYNAISGRVIIINGNRKILCQRDDPKFDIFKLFEVSSEDIQHIRALLDQTSIQNTEISLQLMAKVENKRQMYDLKLHTLWSPLKKDGYIGIVGYLS